MAGRKQKAGEKGPAAQYMTRGQALKKLQLSLSAFRRLCILKNIFPRDPPTKQKKKTGGDKVYYHVKDVVAVQHEPLLHVFRQRHAAKKKINKALGRREKAKAKRIIRARPAVHLHRIVKERFPTLKDAVADIDDALCTIAIYAVLPVYRQRGVKAEEVLRAGQLLDEFLLLAAQQRALRNAFASIKGYYFRLQLLSQEVVFLLPHYFVQAVPDTVDMRVLSTFFSLYSTTLRFVIFKFYLMAGLAYPPSLAPVPRKKKQQQEAERSSADETAASAEAGAAAGTSRTAAAAATGARTAAAGGAVKRPGAAGERELWGDACWRFPVLRVHRIGSEEQQQRNSSSSNATAAEAATASAGGRAARQAAAAAAAEKRYARRKGGEAALSVGTKEKQEKNATSTTADTADSEDEGEGSADESHDEEEETDEEESEEEEEGEEEEEEEEGAESEEEGEKRATGKNLPESKVRAGSAAAAKSEKQQQQQEGERTAGRKGQKQQGEKEAKERKTQTQQAAESAAVDEEAVGKKDQRNSLSESKRRGRKDKGGKWKEEISPCGVHPHPVQRLFENLVFFLSREVPLLPFSFLIRSCGGSVGWQGSGSPFGPRDRRITHHVVDRPPSCLAEPLQLQQEMSSRELIQPQWLLDSINAAVLLPVHAYAPGKILPPHLSPFVDDYEEGYVPQQRKILDCIIAEKRSLGAAAAASAPGLAGSSSRKAQKEDDNSDAEQSHRLRLGERAEEKFQRQLEAEAAGEFAEEESQLAGSTKEEKENEEEGGAATTAEESTSADDEDVQQQQPRHRRPATDSSGKRRDVLPADGAARQQQQQQNRKKRCLTHAGRENEEDEQRAAKKALLSKKHRRLLERIEHGKKEKQEKAARLQAKRRALDREKAAEQNHQQ